MSDALDDVIDIQIVVTDKTPSRKSFGIPLIAAYHTAWVDYVREYADPGEMLDDGFTTADAAYKIATAIKSQDPSPNTFKVGRLTTAAVQTVILTPTTTTQGAVYSGTINGQYYEYTVPAAATAQVIVEAVSLLIGAFTGVSASDDNIKITVVTDTAGQVVDYDIAPRTFLVSETTLAPTLGADLAAINDEDGNWYGLVLDTTSKAAITAAALWVEANKKVFMPQSGDSDVVDGGATTDVASALKTSNYSRTGGIFHRGIGGKEWAAAAWMSVFLVADPGSATPAFKTLATISADQLRTGEISALKAKRFTRYCEMGGVPVTFEGRTSSGRFLDVVRFVDWLQAEMQNDVYFLLLNNPKLPYTDAGISVVKGAMEGTLKKGQTRGGIADSPAPRVIVPLVADTDPIDRADRILRDLHFTARLSGALHSFKITGTLSV